MSVITTGYVRILLTGKYPERFLSICSNKGMVFWKIERIGYNEFKLSIPANQVFLLRPYLKKTRCKIKIINRKGLPFIIKKILKRRGFGTGIICFAVLFFILNSFVWGIDIKGNEKVSADIILNKLSNMGVKPGKIRYGIDTKKIADNLIIEIEDLSWVFVKVKGTKMNIVVAERNKKPTIQEKTPCDLVSSKAGQIYSITVKSGEQKAKNGDTISKGDILVAGTITPKIVGTSARKVHAIADVVARTWYSGMTDVIQSKIDRVRTGNFIQNYNLNLFGKKINCIDSSIPYTKYDTMLQYTSFVPSKIKARVGMEVISIYEVVEKTKEVELKDAFEMATENSMKEIRENMPSEAKLNAAYYHFVHTNTGWVNEVVLECKENIAIENEIKS